jgi:hypothetical protein
MKALQKIVFGLFFTALALSSPVLIRAGSMGVSRGHDLDMLWARAQKEFDLARHDAVLLLASRHVSILENGDKRTRVHRVVWIGTEVGIEDHADLRIPWNEATSTFTVIALRTWNDGRWWPDESKVSETAVVETLPFALAQTADYTSMRETMLLHDGVELPCVMETIYEIEERGTAEGADGLWIFPQGDPAVLVEYILSVPAGITPEFRSGNGAPESRAGDDEGSAASYVWTMENVDRLESPRISFPAMYAPFVSWSTWKDWNALGRAIGPGYDDAAGLNDALGDSLRARLKYEPTPAARVRKIASLTDEWTRNIRYDWGFWRFSPRPAARTWETAYGHGLDRAVLAAALFREAGFGAEWAFYSIPYAEFDGSLPGLSCFEGLAVEVRGDRLHGYYDPAEGKLEQGEAWAYGRVFWRPVNDGTEEFEAPRPKRNDPDHTSGYELMLTIEPGEEGDWKGSGCLSADGLFCPYGEMTGLAGEALAHLERIVQSVLPGASVRGYNPEHFDSDFVTLGFEFTLESGEPDDMGRTRIVFGEPAGAVKAHMPPDVHSYQERRGSPVIIGGKSKQRIELRIKTGDREVLYLPEERKLSNGVGCFALTVEKEGGWVTIERELNIDRPIVPPEEWLALRALLLEETDAAGRMILLE